jgi:hypothetical protein
VLAASNKAAGVRMVPQPKMPTAVGVVGVVAMAAMLTPAASGPFDRLAHEATSPRACSWCMPCSLDAAAGRRPPPARKDAFWSQLYQPADVEKTRATFAVTKSLLGLERAPEAITANSWPKPIQNSHLRRDPA